MNFLLKKVGGFNPCESLFREIPLLGKNFSSTPASAKTPKSHLKSQIWRGQGGGRPRCRKWSSPPAPPAAPPSRCPWPSASHSSVVAPVQQFAKFQFTSVCSPLSNSLIGQSESGSERRDGMKIRGERRQSLHQSFCIRESSTGRSHLIVTRFSLFFKLCVLARKWELVSEVYAQQDNKRPSKKNIASPWPGESW